MHVGPNRLPLALQGAPAAPSASTTSSPTASTSAAATPTSHKARRQLLEDLAKPDEADGDNLLQFVRRRQVADAAPRSTRFRRCSRRQPAAADGQRRPPTAGQLAAGKLQLVARLIDKGFGTRVFYVTIDGFDTHSGQADDAPQAAGELADGVTQFFQHAARGGHDKRVLVMTFSEFGRRVKENGSKGTDHGAGSCLFVAGPAVKGGVGRQAPQPERTSTPAT